MKAVIEITNGNQAGHVAEVKPGDTLVIGRGRAADFQVFDPLISRKHCSLRFAQDGLMLLDMGSANGTVLNGAEVHLAPVPNEAEIRVGSTVLRVSLSNVQAPSRRTKTCVRCQREIGMRALIDGQFEVTEDGIVCTACSGGSTGAALAGDQTLRKVDGSGSSPPIHIPIERLEGFTVRGEVGRSTQGPIFQAYHDFMRREMLLLFLAHGGDGSPAAHQFLEAGKLAGRFQHPHLLRVYEIGPFERTFYASMEFTGTRSLWDEAQAGPLGVEPAYYVLLGVLKGLLYIHEQQIVHGDLVPGKVVLGDDGLVRLSFFNLFFGQDTDLPSGFLARYFTAPERHTGHPGTPVGDLYGAGALFHFALYGHPPYHDVAPQQLGNLPLDTPLKLPTPIPPPLNEVLQRLLARDPAQRYGSAKEPLARLGAL